MAEAKGEPTRIAAVPPAAYVSASGMRSAASSSTLRLGTTAFPPETQRVISVRLARPESSVTRVAMR